MKNKVLKGGFALLCLLVFITSLTSSSQKPATTATDSATPSASPVSVQQVVETPPVQTPTQTVIETPKPTPSPKVQGTSTGLSNDNTYVNSQGNTVHSPAYSDTIPAGATAQCRDGTYSFSQSRRGTCSSHGGVGRWL